MRKTVLLSILTIILLLSIGCESSGITALKVYLQQKKIPEAIREGEAAINMEPSNPEPYFWTGVAYINRQDYINASDYIIKALEKGLTIEDLNKRYQGEGLDNWNYYAVFLTAGVQSLGDEQYSKAKEFLNVSIQLEPDSATSYAILGSVYRDTDNFDSMMTLYNLALEKDPGNFSAMKNLGLYYLNSSEEYVKAEEIFKKALVDYDTSASLWYYSALANFNLANKAAVEGNLDERTAFLQNSESDFSHAVNISPDFRTGEIALYRSLVLVTLEDYEGSIPVLKEAIENIDDEDPNKDKIFYNLGVSYHSLERYSEAITAFTNAIELNEVSKYYNMRADCYNKTDQRDKAQEDLKRAQELSN